LEQRSFSNGSQKTEKLPAKPGMLSYFKTCKSVLYCKIGSENVLVLMKWRKYTAGLPVPQSGDW